MSAAQARKAKAPSSAGRSRTSRPKAYSYVRWSSPAQSEGDTLRRQLERAKQYAETHGLELSDLRWEDAGKSAFRGKNWHEGALGAFVKAVDAGEVPPGSYLLVEALDRLSRDDVFPALQRMHEIARRGVTIVTLSDQREWTADSFKNLEPLYYSIALLSTANLESANKAMRSRAYWKHKRELAAEKGIAPTAICPLWLTIGPDGKYQPIPERVAVLKRIYQMALDGIGSRRIARILNDEGVPKFIDPSRPKPTDKRGWSGAYIHAVLSSDAPIGVWRGYRVEQTKDFKRRRVQDGEPVEGVYPAVIDKDIWLRVQRDRRRISGKKRTNRPQGLAALSMTNLFTGIARCSCGSTMRYHNPGKNSSGKPKRTKLVCSAQLSGERVGRCKRRYWDYRAVVEAFSLYALAEHVDFRKVLPATYKVAQSTVARLRKERSETEVNLRIAEERADRIVAAIEKGTDSPRMHARLKHLEDEAAAHRTKLDELDQQITDEHARMKSAERTFGDAQEALQEFIQSTWSRPYAPGDAFGFKEHPGGYVAPPSKVSPEDSYRMRLKLHTMLRQAFPDGITFDARKGHVLFPLADSGVTFTLAVDGRETHATWKPGELVMELSNQQVGRVRFIKSLLHVWPKGQEGVEEGDELVFAV